MTNQEEMIPQKQLAIGEVLDFLAITNSELRCLALTAISPDTVTAGTDAYKEVMAIPSGSVNTAPFSEGDFNSMLARHFNDFVVTTHDSQGRRSFIKTRAGHLATSLAGHRLDLSVKSNVATGVLLGEHVPSRPTIKGQRAIGSIEARIIMLHGLHKLSAHGWQRNGRLYMQLAEHGVSERLAAYHLGRLEDSNIVERRTRPNPHGGRFFEHRLSTNRYFETSELVGRFLAIIAHFSILDDAFLSSGQELAVGVLSNKRYVPGLVKRAVYNDSHFRRTPKPKR